jgi:hypothetical protein
MRTAIHLCGCGLGQGAAAPLCLPLLSSLAGHCQPASGVGAAAPRAASAGGGRGGAHGG